MLIATLAMQPLNTQLRRLIPQMPRQSKLDLPHCFASTCYWYEFIVDYVSRKE